MNKPPDTPLARMGCLMILITVGLLTMAAALPPAGFLH